MTILAGVGRAPYNSLPWEWQPVNSAGKSVVWVGVVWTWYSSLPAMQYLVGCVSFMPRVSSMGTKDEQVGAVEVAGGDGSHLILPLCFYRRVCRGVCGTRKRICGNEAGAEGKGQTRFGVHSCSSIVDLEGFKRLKQGTTLTAGDRVVVDCSGAESVRHTCLAKKVQRDG